MLKSVQLRRNYYYCGLFASLVASAFGVVRENKLCKSFPFFAAVLFLWPEDVFFVWIFVEDCVFSF